MFWFAATLAVAFAALAGYERRRRKAAEHDRDDADAHLGRREADYTDQAERYQKAIESCRLRTQEALADRDKAEAALTATRRELEADRLDRQQRARATGEAVATGQRRERKAAELIQEALTILSP